MHSSCRICLCHYWAERMNIMCNWSLACKISWFNAVGSIRANLLSVLGNPIIASSYGICYLPQTANTSTAFELTQACLTPLLAFSSFGGTSTLQTTVPAMTCGMELLSTFSSCKVIFACTTSVIYFTVVYAKLRLRNMLHYWCGFFYAYSLSESWQCLGVVSPVDQCRPAVEAEHPQCPLWVSSLILAGGTQFERQYTRMVESNFCVSSWLASRRAIQRFAGCSCIRRTQ